MSKNETKKASRFPGIAVMVAIAVFAFVGGFFFSFSFSFSPESADAATSVNDAAAYVEDAVQEVGHAVNDVLDNAPADEIATNAMARMANRDRYVLIVHHVAPAMNRMNIVGVAGDSQMVSPMLGEMDACQMMTT